MTRNAGGGAMNARGLGTAAQMLLLLAGVACVAFGAYLFFLHTASAEAVTIEPPSCNLTAMPGQAFAVHLTLHNTSDKAVRLVGLGWC